MVEIYIYMYVCGMLNISLSFLRMIIFKFFNINRLCDYFMFWYINGGIGFGRYLVLLNLVVFIVFKLYFIYNVDNL